MKKTCFLLLVLICSISAFVGCSNGEKNSNYKINENKINDRLLYNKITNLVNEEYLKEAFADDFKSKYELIILPEDYDVVEKSLIEDAAIIECCKEKDILIDKDSTAKYAKKQFKEMNADDSQRRYNEILENKLSEFKITENEYLDLICEEAFYKYNRESLCKYFIENLYEENTDKTLDVQFNAYIELLLKK